MISDEALSLAIERGVITAEQAEALRGLAQDHPLPPPPPLPPPLPQQLPPPLPVKAVDAPLDAYAARRMTRRCVSSTSFADIFVSLGFVFFFSSAYYLLGLYVGKQRCGRSSPYPPGCSRNSLRAKHRMALPSIVLLGLFATAIFRAVMDLNPAVVSGPMFAPFYTGAAPRDWPLYWLGGSAPVIIEAGLATALATAAYCWRFVCRSPSPPASVRWSRRPLQGSFWFFRISMSRVFDAVGLILGLGVFALAMHFDMADPARQTRRADIAFWLRLLAAPLMVHSLISAIEPGAFDGTSAIFSRIDIYVILGLVPGYRPAHAACLGPCYAGGAFGR